MEPSAVLTTQSPTTPRVGIATGSSLQQLESRSRLPSKILPWVPRVITAMPNIAAVWNFTMALQMCLNIWGDFALGHKERQKCQVETRCLSSSIPRSILIVDSKQNILRRQRIHLQLKLRQRCHQQLQSHQQLQNHQPLVCVVFFFLCCTCTCQSLPRVLRLFGLRVGTRRDSGDIKFYYHRISALKQRKPVWNKQSKKLNFLDVPRVSPGTHPLTKKPEDSGYEIDVHT